MRRGVGWEQRALLAGVKLCSHLRTDALLKAPREGGYPQSSYPMRANAGPSTALY